MMMIIGAGKDGFVWVGGSSWMGYDLQRLVKVRGNEIGEERGGEIECSGRLAVEVEILISLRVMR